jgi:hypothetical protein
MTGAGLLVESLEKGVKYIGVTRAKIDMVYDMLLDSRIKRVLCWGVQCRLRRKRHGPPVKKATGFSVNFASRDCRLFR